MKCDLSTILFHCVTSVLLFALVIVATLVTLLVYDVEKNAVREADPALCAPIANETLTTLIFRGTKTHDAQQLAERGKASGRGVGTIIAFGDEAVASKAKETPPCTGQWFPQEERFCAGESYLRGFDRGVAQTINTVLTRLVPESGFLLVLSPAAAAQTQSPVELARLLYTATDGSSVVAPAAACGVTNGGVCNLNMVSPRLVADFAGRLHARPLTRLLVRNDKTGRALLERWQALCTIPRMIMPACCEDARSRSGTHNTPDATFNAALFGLEMPEPARCWVDPLRGVVVKGKPPVLFGQLRQWLYEPWQRSSARPCGHDPEPIKGAGSMLADKIEMPATLDSDTDLLGMFCGSTLTAYAANLVHRSCLRPDRAMQAAVGTGPVRLMDEAEPGAVTVWLCLKGKGRGFVVVDADPNAIETWYDASKAASDARWVSMIMREF